MLVYFNVIFVLMGFFIKNSSCSSLLLNFTYPLMYSTDDVQATYDALRSKGVEFLAPPAKEFWGTYVMMKDSEGNIFCIGQEAEKA